MTVATTERTIRFRVQTRPMQPLSLLLSIETRFEISIGIITAGNDLVVNWLLGKSIFDNPSKRCRRSALSSLG